MMVQIPLCHIAYSAEFIEVMGFFRAALALGEKSLRAYALTTKVIELNAANYTAWHFRRECIFENKLDLRVELAYAANLAAESPKNYQIWHHRQAIVDALGDSERGELEFLRSANRIRFQELPRVDVSPVAFASLWRMGWRDGVCRIADSERDARNNSAWNQRWSVISNTENAEDMQVVGREIEYG